MNSPVQVPASETETTSLWTDEKHVDFLNSMEASFVRTMFQNKICSTNHHNHQHQQHQPRFLRLDRYLPDSSESTLDLKPQQHQRRRTRKPHAPSDVMGPRIIRKTRRRSSQPFNSSQDQVVPQVEENESKVASSYCDGDKGADN